MLISFVEENIVKLLSLAKSMKKRTAIEATAISWPGKMRLSDFEGGFVCSECKEVTA